MIQQLMKRFVLHYYHRLDRGVNQGCLTGGCKGAMILFHHKIFHYLHYNIFILCHSKPLQIRKFKRQPWGWPDAPLPWFRLLYGDQLFLLRSLDLIFETVELSSQVCVPVLALRISSCVKWTCMVTMEMNIPTCSVEPGSIVLYKVYTPWAKLRKNCSSHCLLGGMSST